MGGSTGQYTLNNTSTDIIIGSGGTGRGITFHTSAYADNMTISFHANENLSRAEGEIKYGPPLTTTTADRNAMMFRTNSAERLRIKSNGQIVLGSDGSNSELTFSQDGSTGIILYSTTTGFGGYNTFTVNSASFVHKYGSDERLRIDSNGRLLLGTDTARAVGGESNPRFHIEGSGATSNSWVNITRFAANNGSANIQFAKSRSNSPGTYTVVQDDDNLGQISFLGADGNRHG